MTNEPESEHLPRLILEDLPCTGCGFNLRGLPSDRACPDCGAPVSRSIPTTTAGLAPAPGVSPIAPSAPPIAPRARAQPLLTPGGERGFALVLWSIGAEIIVALLALAVGVGLSMVLGQAVWIAMMLISLGAMIARIVQTRGWWLITARGAFGSDPPPPGVARGLCRVMVLLHLAASILNSLVLMGLYMAALMGDGWPLNFSAVASVPGFVEVIVGAIAYGAKMLVLVRIGGWVGGATFLGAARLWLWLGPLMIVVARAWNTAAGFAGPGVFGVWIDALLAPMLWVVAELACWWVVKRVSGSLGRARERGNP